MALLLSALASAGCEALPVSGPARVSATRSAGSRAPTVNATVATPSASASARPAATLTTVQPRSVELRARRYVTKDRGCLQVTGSVRWERKGEKPLFTTVSELDERVTSNADAALRSWARRHSAVAARQLQPQQLASQLDAIMTEFEVHDGSSPPQFTVLGVTVDAIPACRFEPHSVSLPKERYMTSDKGCVAVGATVRWDLASQQPGYTDTHLDYWDERVGDVALAELRQFVASKEQAAVLKTSKQQLATALLRAVKEHVSSSYHLDVVELRVDELGACQTPFQ